MQRGLERCGVSARLGMKPVALQHAVVERRIGVLVVGVGLMKRAIGGGAIVLIRGWFRAAPDTARRSVSRCSPVDSAIDGNFMSAVVSAE